MTTRGSMTLPCPRYRDASAALDWLCNAFGLQRHAVHADGDTLYHAQLTCGLGGVLTITLVDQGRGWGRLVVRPDEFCGSGTGSCSSVVTDPDPRCARAKTAGSAVEFKVADLNLGSRGDGHRHKAGHLGWLGSYEPRAA